MKAGIDSYSFHRYFGEVYPGLQENLAVRVRSVGATQLDAINVESGNGHQHVYLPAAGVGGAFSADPAPEGSGAHEHEN